MPNHPNPMIRGDIAELQKERLSAASKLGTRAMEHLADGDPDAARLCFEKAGEYLKAYEDCYSEFAIGTRP